VVVVLVFFYILNEIKSTIKTIYWQRKVGGAPFKLVKNTNSKKENHCQSTSDKKFFTKHESTLFFQCFRKNINTLLKIHIRTLTVDEQEGNFKEILSQGTVKMTKLKMYLRGATCC
jgi:hypothetical protein